MLSPAKLTVRTVGSILKPGLSLRRDHVLRVLLKEHAKHLVGTQGNDNHAAHDAEAEYPSERRDKDLGNYKIEHAAHPTKGRTKKETPEVSHMQRKKAGKSRNPPALRRSIRTTPQQ